LTNPAYDRLRLESDSIFWSTGLRRSEAIEYFMNGARHTLDPSRIQESIHAALQETIPRIQELTYYGYIDNFANILDSLMAQDVALVSSFNPQILKFSGAVLPMSATPAQIRKLIELLLVF
jgi:hypothetical protein